jgi:N-[(2S)-2-amino-2-carboxyethyl]-L-glutamate dehydrogenase
MLVLRGPDIHGLLAGSEVDIMEVVASAYMAHARGHTSVPHSTFLRFPDNAGNRIIALPAYLGAEWDTAGIKWISSFPANTRVGLERATAVMILNSTQTGEPTTILEGSLISALRTGASAAVAARVLHPVPPRSVGMVGCGRISLNILRFLCKVWPQLGEAQVFDLDPSRAARFQASVNAELPTVTVSRAASAEDLARRHSLVSFATTASEPHVADLSCGGQGCVVLHISLRDIAPRAILECHNVVDDPDHACRASTSLHLAEQLVGDRSFISCSLGDILIERVDAPASDSRPVVFSPFGLGILDLAVASLVRQRALAQDVGVVIEDFA